MKSSPWRALAKTYDIWRNQHLSLQAAGLAFYFALSLGPLLIILTDVVALIVGQKSAQTDLLAPLQPTIGAHAIRFIEALESTVLKRSNTALPSIVSIIVLLVGSAGIFEQLKETLDGIWETKPNAKFGILLALKNRFFSVVLVAACAMLILLLVSMSALVAQANADIIQAAPFLGKSGNIVHPVVSIVALTIVFGVTFKMLPDAPVRWSDVWIGAASTAVLIALGQFLIGLFMARTGMETTRGFATAVVVLLLWLYYSAQIYLLGAAFTRAVSLQREHP